MKIAIPATLILAGVVILLVMGISRGAIPEIHVAALRAGQFPGETVRLLGKIHSIESDVRPMRFTICDMKDPTVRVVAVVDDHRPDIFAVDNDVAVVGVYDPATQMLAGTRVFTKCPSKYEATDAMGSAGAYGQPGAVSSPPPAEPAAVPAPE